MDVQSSFNLIRPEHTPRRGGVPRVNEPATGAQDTGQRVEKTGHLRASQADDVLDSAQNFQRQTGYDKPEGKGEQAVFAYQSLERETQRDNIRQLLGVDIYA